MLRPKRSKWFRHVYNWVSLFGLFSDENWFALFFCEKGSLHLLSSSLMHINVVKIVNLTVKVICDFMVCINHRVLHKFKQLASPIEMCVLKLHNLEVE